MIYFYFSCKYFCLVSPTPRVPAGRAPLPTPTSDGCRSVGLQLGSRGRPRLGGSEAVCPGLRVCCLEIPDSWTHARHGDNVMDRSYVIIFTLSLNNMMDHNCITMLPNECQLMKYTQQLQQKLISMYLRLCAK